MSTKTWLTGFPRMGENRELKKALEAYWAGKTSYHDLENTARDLRKKHWILQKEKGIDFVSSHDFSLYDNMLDTAVMLNAVPQRFRNIQDKEKQYFAMARGTSQAMAMEMTKWFNTNYHYIVPEIDHTTPFQLNDSKIVSEYQEAKALGIKTKINVIGPITFLALSKTSKGQNPQDFFPQILEVYKDLFRSLAKLDDSVYLQMEEPIFVKDPQEDQLALLKEVYQELASIDDNIKVIVTTYFEHAGEAVKALASTPVWGLGLDFVHGPKNMEFLDFLGEKKLIAGLVDGLNIWITDYAAALKTLEKITEKVPKDQVILSTSCSLLHIPYSKDREKDSVVNQWLSFSCEKAAELVCLAEIFHSGKNALFEENQLALKKKADSPLLSNPKTAQRMGEFKKTQREGSFNERIRLQKEHLNLPLLPTTTIGSFPQTREIRKLRRDFKKNLLSASQYEDSLKAYIDECVAFQEAVNLDVLVHGEPERNDMVEYFGALLEGFHFTENGWVQSYGSRCVKAPVIYGDISRPEPMTVKWIAYAQSKTKKPMKAMLTGPVTILNWSFVRTDIPKSVVAKQIAMALSDEIADLQKENINIIQVDEAAFKEGYPLRKENIPSYENWSIASFKAAVSTAKKETQIHTHMCYSQFNQIIKAIEAMDADVITIETARSGNKILQVFQDTGYKNEIGPGVYDIHSPRIPPAAEIEDQIKTRLEVIKKDQMWVNPDCGLKTRTWDEVKPALTNMVNAAIKIRKDGEA